MDKKLQHIQHLYGEADTSDALLRDEALRAEYAALHEVKMHLDQRERPRPDAAVLDRIVSAAAQAAPAAPAGRRADRAPRRHARYTLLAAVTACAVFVVAGIALLQDGLFAPPAEQEAAFSEISPEADASTPAQPEASADGMLFEDEARPEGAESFALQRAPRPAETAVGDAAAPPSFRSEARSAAVKTDRLVLERESVMPRERADETPPSPAPWPSNSLGREVVVHDMDQEAASFGPLDTLLTWDESPELLEVHHRIEWLKARSTTNAWDDPALLSLDALPVSSTTPTRAEQGIRQVGAQPVKKDNQ